MLEQPLITIDNFSLMGDSGVFYSEGFAVKNGGKQLDEEYDANEYFYSGQTGYSTVGIIKTLLNVPTYDGSSGYNIILDDSGRFFVFDPLARPSSKNKYVSTMSGHSINPDLALLDDGNVIVGNSATLGLLVRGKCKTGSGTTKIIDFDGRNLATYGVSTSSPNNKVVNIKTGEEFTITSLSNDGGGTNDTVNFTAGTNTNTAGDEFMIVVGTTKGTINSSATTDFDLSTGITFFKGQVAESQFNRQIVDYDDGNYILNGNYLARFEIISGTYTLETMYKQLPKKAQATSICVNTDKILVSAYDNNGGMLLLWDGFSDGWNNILPIEASVKALTRFNDGWLYILNGVLYYTNGYSIEKISEMPEAKRIDVNNSTIPYHPTDFYGIRYYNNILYCAIPLKDNNSRICPAVYAFDFKYGWTKIPILKATKMFGVPYNIFIEKIIASSETTSEELFIGGDGTLNNIDTSNPVYTANKSKSYMVLIPLNREVKVKAIGLNIGYRADEYVRTTSAKNTSITVNIGDGKFGFLNKIQTTSSGYSTNGFTIDASQLGLNIGDEIQILQGASAGERTYISNIVDGTTISVSPALSTQDIASAYNIKVTKVKKAEQKTIPYNQLDNEKIFYFNTAFQSNKILLEIVVNGIANSFPISIYNINIYGN